MLAFDYAAKYHVPQLFSMHVALRIYRGEPVTRPSGANETDVLKRVVGFPFMRCRNLVHVVNESH